MITADARLLATLLALAALLAVAAAWAGYRLAKRKAAAIHRRIDSVELSRDEILRRLDLEIGELRDGTHQLRSLALLALLGDEVCRAREEGDLSPPGAERLERHLLALRREAMAETTRVTPRDGGEGGPAAAGAHGTADPGEPREPAASASSPAPGGAPEPRARAGSPRRDGSA